MEKKYKFWEMGASPKRLSQYKGDKIKKGSHDYHLHGYSWLSLPWILNGGKFQQTKWHEESKWNYLKI